MKVMRVPDDYTNARESSTFNEHNRIHVPLSYVDRGCNSKDQGDNQNTKSEDANKFVGTKTSDRSEQQGSQVKQNSCNYCDQTSQEHRESEEQEDENEEVQEDAIEEISSSSSSSDSSLAISSYEVEEEEEEEEEEGDGSISIESNESNLDLENEEAATTEDDLSSGYEEVEDVFDHERVVLFDHYNWRHNEENVDEFEDLDSLDDMAEIERSTSDEYLKHDPTPDTPYPRPEWRSVNEMINRRFGIASSRQPIPKMSASLFKKHVNNSLWMIQRLEKTKSLKQHTGSVNCLDFSTSGRLLCSGSDDKYICIWDWQWNKLNKRICSNHSANIIYCTFLNYDSEIITSSRDGTIRLMNVETSQTEQLLKVTHHQKYEIGKLAFMTPQTIATCCTNGVVNLIDLRTRVISKLFTVQTPGGRLCPLHTIDSHPIDRHKIVVAGSSPYVFQYDLRRVSSDPYDSDRDKPAYCFDSLENDSNIITSTAFNSYGDKLLISYNDDDLVVCGFESRKIIHRYKGHRNKKTIKNCSWFGDNFVMSGSDDGHIYGWDLNSEHIVCFLEADDRGIVNCLTVHPEIPVLASSGLDNDVKIWEPIANTWPQALIGIKKNICKNTMRRKAASHRRQNGGFIEIIDVDDSDADL